MRAKLKSHAQGFNSACKDTYWITPDMHLVCHYANLDLQPFSNYEQEFGPALRYFGCSGRPFCYQRFFFAPCRIRLLSVGAMMVFDPIGVCHIMIRKISRSLPSD
ncbi:hypothetical protein BJX64DRAFT_137076 [Aspergillus heterothallicus]